MKESKQQPSAPANWFRLDRDVAWITGGGTGLGLALAQCMAEACANVVIGGLAAVYICSPAAKFVTGTVLLVDWEASIGF